MLLNFDSVFKKAALKFSISKTLVALCFSLLMSAALTAQVIQNGSSYKLFSDSNYVRFNYENDLFSGTDQYYTQGVNLEWVCTALQPLRHVLITPINNINYFGIALEQDVFTPTSITSSTILNGARPFAATLTLKAFATSSNPYKHYTLTSALTIGVIGPAAGGYQTQKSIHEVTNGVKPQGWQYQIKNDLLLNYHIGLEKNIFNSNSFLINVLGIVEAGSLNSKITAGGTFILGKLNNTLKVTFGKGAAKLKPQKFTFHLYAQPLINVVLYDAALQGGFIFNSDSPYTIEDSKITRITFQGNAGIVLNYGALYVEYSQSVLSEEFSGGGAHRWGGICLGLKF